MPLETGTYVTDLIETNPDGAVDKVLKGDDHLRLIKKVLKNTFPNADRGFRFSSTSTPKVANYTVTNSDENSLIPVDATSGDIDISLPTVASVPDGFIVTIFKSDATTNTVTIKPSVGGVINGGLAVTLVDQYEGCRLQATSNGWFKVAFSDVPRLLVFSINSDFSVSKNKQGVLLNVVNDATLTIEDLANLGVGWLFAVKAKEGKTVTINMQAGQKVNGVSSIVLPEGSITEFVVVSGTEMVADVVDTTLAELTNGTRLGKDSLLVTDCNDAKENGFYVVANGANQPAPGHWALTVTAESSTAQLVQYADGVNTANSIGKRYRRTFSNPNWSIWERIYCTGTEVQSLFTIPENAEFSYTTGTGVNGITLPDTTWTKVPFNTTEVNNVTGASVASGDITLPVGVFEIEVIVNFYSGTTNERAGAIRLVKNGSVIYTSRNVSYGIGDEVEIPRIRVALSAVSTLKVEAYAVNSFTLGHSIPSFTTNKYAEFNIRKIK